MAGNRTFTIDRVVLAILWLGMGGFVAFHSALLFSRSQGDPAVWAFRVAWFVGLGLVAVMLVYFRTRSGSTADGT